MKWGNTASPENRGSIIGFTFITSLQNKLLEKASNGEKQTTYFGSQSNTYTTPFIKKKKNIYNI